MPVFLSEDVSNKPTSLPFKFVGGFALPTKVIGIIMSVQGVYSMIAQVLLFPFIVRKFGSLATFRFVVISWPLLYFIVPYTVLLPERLQIAGIFFCLIWRITAQVLAFPSIAILLANSVPSLNTLGLINGTAASIASLARAIGPATAGLTHTWGLDLGYAGFAWWGAGIICIIGGIESLWVEDNPGRMDAVDAEDEEAALHEPYISPSAIDAAIVAVTAENGSHGPCHDEPE